MQKKRVNKGKHHRRTSKLNVTIEDSRLHSTSDRFSFRSLTASFVSMLALLFFATLGLPPFLMAMITHCRSRVSKYFLRKRRQASHKRMLKQQAEFLAFIAILQEMKGGSTPGKKGFQKGTPQGAGRGRTSQSGRTRNSSSVMSDNLSSQQTTPSDRRRSQPSKRDSARAQVRSDDSRRFSLPTVLSDLDSVATSQDSHLDQYDAATIDGSFISERKRRRWGKRKSRRAGPGRGHKTIFSERLFQVFSIFHVFYISS